MEQTELRHDGVLRSSLPQPTIRPSSGPPCLLQWWLCKGGGKDRVPPSEIRKGRRCPRRHSLWRWVWGWLSESSSESASSGSSVVIESKPPRLHRRLLP